MKFFSSNNVPILSHRLLEQEEERWARIVNNLNVLGPHGFQVGSNINIVNYHKLNKYYTAPIAFTINRNLIKHFFQGKTLFVSGLLGGNMKTYDLQILGLTKPIKHLLKMNDIFTYKLKSKNYICFQFDDISDVYTDLEKFVFKIKRDFDISIALRGIPAKFDIIEIHNQKIVKPKFNHNLMELNRALLDDEWFDRFLLRKKNSVKSLQKFISDVDGNYVYMMRTKLYAELSSYGINICDEETGGETLKPYILTEGVHPESFEEKTEPKPALERVSSLEALADSEIIQDHRSAVSAKASTAEERSRDGCTPSMVSLSNLQGNSSINNSFNVSPPMDNISQQLSIVYDLGTNNAVKFCYSTRKEKNGKTRNRYLNKDKFVAYSKVIIHSSGFSKINSINWFKYNFKNFTTDIKWHNDDFIYVKKVLKENGIINESNSYRPKYYGKKITFESGSLTFLLNEGLQVVFKTL